MLLNDPSKPSRTDLKNPFFEITAVTDDRTHLSDSQKFILDYFAAKTEGKRFINRSELVPAELIKYLPNVGLIDLEYDEQGNLTNFIGRLIGTAIADFYGDFTGVSVHSDIIKNSAPGVQDRLFAQVNAAIEHRNGITAKASASFKNSSGLHINTLFIPMSSNNCDVDMVFFYVEVHSNS